MAEYLEKEAILSNLIEQIEKGRDTAECEATELVIKRFAEYIKSFPAADVRPVSVIKKLQEHIKQHILETAFNNGGIYREVAEDIAERIDIWVDEFERAENDT